MTNFRMLMALSTLLMACAPSTSGLKAPTSGAVGCAPAQITIADDTGEWSNPRTWTAECGGKKFYCMGAANSMKPLCNESQTPKPS